MGIYGIRPLKKFAQNFLIDGRIGQKIIDCARLEEEDSVLEIGAGHGELTGLIADKAGKVIAIEMDKKLCRLLNKKFSKFENVEIVEGDILKQDMRKLTCGGKKLTSGKRTKVIGNLPYYITTPILMKLFDEKDLFSQLIIMVQREVADRMSADPGSKTYGALSVAVCYHAKVKEVIPVSRRSFYPEPEVDSCLISMNIRKVPPVTVSDEKSFFSFIKGTFSERRKMLYNAIPRAVPIGKKEAEEMLLRIGIDPKVRPEKLSLNEFARIFDMLK